MSSADSTAEEGERERAPKAASISHREAPVLDAARISGARASVGSASAGSLLLSGPHGGLRRGRFLLPRGFFGDLPGPRHPTPTIAPLVARTPEDTSDWPTHARQGRGGGASWAHARNGTVAGEVAVGRVRSLANRGTQSETHDPPVRETSAAGAGALRTTASNIRRAT